MAQTYIRKDALLLCAHRFTGQDHTRYLVWFFYLPVINMATYRHTQPDGEVRYTSDEDDCGFAESRDGCKYREHCTA